VEERLKIHKCKDQLCWNIIAVIQAKDPDTLIRAMEKGKKGNVETVITRTP
jgi:hypothetical protein